MARANERMETTMHTNDRHEQYLIYTVSDARDPTPVEMMRHEFREINDFNNRFAQCFGAVAIAALLLSAPIGVSILGAAVWFVVTGDVGWFGRLSVLLAVDLMLFVIMIAMALTIDD